MFKKSEETVCRMKGNHHFQNICPLYKGMSGRSELTQKFKIHVRAHHRPIWKNPYKLITVTGWTKICSGRYHNDNIFKNVHGHQKKSHWKDVLNIVHIFMHVDSWCKKQYWLSVTSNLFLLYIKVLSLKSFENVFIMRCRGRPFNI